MIQPRGLITSILFVCLACFSVTGFAQTGDPEAVLIRNVLLIDPNEQAEDRVVNTLIREDKLEIITEDKISREEADLVAKPYFWCKPKLSLHLERTGWQQRNQQRY